MFANCIAQNFNKIAQIPAVGPKPHISPILPEFLLDLANKLAKIRPLLPRL
jgi:hypothetical protein